MVQQRWNDLTRVIANVGVVTGKGITTGIGSGDENRADEGVAGKVFRAFLSSPLDSSNEPLVIWPCMDAFSIGLGDAHRESRITQILLYGVSELIS